MLEKYLSHITQGDCLTLFKDIPDNSVDITFADPPFNLKKKYNSTKDGLAIQEYLNWCERWLSEMVRVTKPTGSVFVHNIPKWLTYYTSFLNRVAHFKHWVSWDAPTSPMGKTLQPSHYGILFYAKEVKQNKFYEVRYPHKRCRKCHYLYKDYGGKKPLLHPFGPLVADVWTDIHRVKHNKYRDEHPCQLPIHLLERIILMSTDEGDTVLDPFSGTGTTVVAGEVRNLAGRSAKASKETAELIESSMIKVEKGNEIAARTSEALNRIVESVSKVADLVAEISAACNEQAQGITHVNHGLGQIENVTQRTTANAEQTASAAQELASQAVQLKAMLGRFQLTEQICKPVLTVSEAGRTEKKKPETERKRLPNIKTEEMVSLDDTDFGKY